MTAKAAYRAAEIIPDARTGELHDYSRKRGVLHSEIAAPANAPAWMHERQRLWNAAEMGEKRKDSQVGRELLYAVPSDVSREEQQRIAREIAACVVSRHGAAVDWSLHAPHPEGDERNYHIHMLISTRRVGPDGFTEKMPELDDRRLSPKTVDSIRAEVAASINRSLERCGRDYRVDHRSFERRGIDREPQRHKGPAATEMERRAAESRIVKDNRAIAERNRQQEQRRAAAKVIDLNLEREKRRAAERQAAERKEVPRMADPERPWTKRQRGKTSTAEPKPDELARAPTLKARQKKELADFTAHRLAVEKRLADEKEAATKTARQREEEYRADRLAQVREEHQVKRRGFARFRETMKGFYETVRNELAKITSRDPLTETIERERGGKGWLALRGNQAAREIAEPTARHRQRIERTVVEGSKARERDAARQEEQRHEARKTALDAAQTLKKHSLDTRQRGERQALKDTPSAAAGFKTAQQAREAKPQDVVRQAARSDTTSGERDERGTGLAARLAR